MSWWEFRGFWGILQRSPVVFIQVGTYLFGTEFAADKGVDVLNQLRIELIGFSPVLFGQPALLLCFFGAVLLSLDAVPLDFAADGAFVAVELFGDFGDGAVAGQVLDMVSFVLGQLCVAHGNLSCRKGRMLPHTGLFLLWKVALQMRIRRPFDVFFPKGRNQRFFLAFFFSAAARRMVRSAAITPSACPRRSVRWLCATHCRPRPGMAV